MLSVTNNDSGGFDDEAVCEIAAVKKGWRLLSLTFLLFALIGDKITP